MLKRTMFVIALGTLPLASDARAQVVQDNIFGDNIVQQNVISRPAHRVVRKTVRSGKVVNNNTYIINEAPAIVSPSVSTTIIQRRPIVRYVYPSIRGYYYYPPGSFY